jgi:hypothetical protein
MKDQTGLFKGNKYKIPIPFVSFKLNLSRGIFYTL